MCRGNIGRDKRQNPGKAIFWVNREGKKLWKSDQGAGRDPKAFGVLEFIKKKKKEFKVFREILNRVRS